VITVPGDGALANLHNLPENAALEAPKRLQREALIPGISKSDG
jgi:hypothetical protein